MGGGGEEVLIRRRPVRTEFRNRKKEIGNQTGWDKLRKCRKYICLEEKINKP